jgi:negative regulator of flagellin synthesis FlgM
MKIGNSPDGSASPPKVEQRPAARKSESAPSNDVVRPSVTSAPAPSTQVEISSAAKMAATAAGSDDGSFDAAKVDRIAKAISEGKFTVNARAIADKLVANAQELLDARANKSLNS